MSVLLGDAAAFFRSSVRSSLKSRTLVLLAAAAILSLGAVLTRRASAGNPPPQQGGRLTVEQLGDALSSFGKNTVSNNGQVYYSVNCGHGQWKSSVVISLSPNGNFIWMTIDPAAMPDPAKTSLPALLNLLKKNTDIGPMFFSINGRRLRLSYPVPNYDLTTGRVKAYVQTIVDTAVATMSLWDPVTLEGSGASPTL